MTDEMTTPEGGAGRAAPANDTSKLLAALGYPLWFPVAIVALLLDPYKSEPFVRLHAVQGIALGLVAVILAWIPFLGWIASFAVFIYEIVLAIRAFRGEYFEVPVVYGFVKNYV